VPKALILKINRNSPTYKLHKFLVTTVRDIHALY